MWSAVVEQIGEMPAKPEVETEESMEAWQNEMDAYRRAISKTPEYIEFHKAKIEKGQRASSLIGNQYTGSIFLALCQPSRVILRTTQT